MANLVTTEQEILENVATLTEYLQGTEAQKIFASNLLKKGRNFVAIESGNKWTFGPSRFVGYSNNTQSKHSAARDQNAIDGRETDPEIDKLLGNYSKPEDTGYENIESAFLSYCGPFGITPDRYTRKYWLVRQPKRFAQNDEDEIDYDYDNDYWGSEGRRVIKRHKTRERNRRLVRLKKESVQRALGKLECEACSFDFEKSYGELGEGFIECHHTIPVSELPSDGSSTRLEDLALICSNCHRMIHRGNPMLTVSELKNLLNTHKKQ